MILVDTSVWVDHLRSGDASLTRLLSTGLVLGHPWVAGELALGNLAQRQTILSLVQALPLAVVATDVEVLSLIDRHRLHGRGIGYVDAHLLAAGRLTPGAQLWTRDKRLAAAAADVGIGFAPPADPAATNTA